LRALLCVFLLIAAGIAVICATGIGEREHSARSGWHVASRSIKIAPWVLERTANGENAEFFVVLADQADLRPAAALATKAEKARYVYDALWNKSQATQGAILQWLRERGIEHRSFYIVNAMFVKGSLEIAEALAARPDVARVEGNPQIKNILPQPDAAVKAASQPKNPATIEPGIAYTQAPDVWALGF
jgi:serine protease AprX